jgi:hypothetical protein
MIFVVTSYLQMWKRFWLETNFLQVDSPRADEAVKSAFKKKESLTSHLVRAH